MSSNQKEYNFILVLSGVTKPNIRIEDALFNAGCGDSTLSFRNQVGYLEFDRKSTTLKAALLTAIRDVESADIGVQITRIEPGDLVNAAEIARRLNWTREYIRLLVQGKRGLGQFPAPQSGITSKTLIWSWAEVIQWLAAQNKIKDKSLLNTASTIRDINVALEYLNDPPTYQRRMGLLQELRRFMVSKQQVKLSRQVAN